MTLGERPSRSHEGWKLGGTRVEEENCGGKNQKERMGPRQGGGECTKKTGVRAKGDQKSREKKVKPEDGSGKARSPRVDPKSAGETEGKKISKKRSNGCKMHCQSGEKAGTRGGKEARMLAELEGCAGGGEKKTAGPKRNGKELRVKTAPHYPKRAAVAPLSRGSLGGTGTASTAIVRKDCRRSIRRGGKGVVTTREKGVKNERAKKKKPLPTWGKGKKEELSHGNSWGPRTKLTSREPAAHGVAIKGGIP